MKETKTERINMKIAPDVKNYLFDTAWKNRMSATKYLEKLVYEDMEKHPDWKDGKKEPDTPESLCLELYDYIGDCEGMSEEVLGSFYSRLVILGIIKEK